MELPEFFGLDLGDHSVKIAQVKRKGNGADLQKVGAVALPFGIFENESEDGINQIADTLKKLRQESKITTPNCVAAIPEAPIFSRLLTIPRVDEDKLQETVHWELKPLIPVSLDEVDIAFLEVGQSNQSGQEMVDIYAVASPKNIVEKYKNVLSRAGYNLIALETESLSNARNIAFNYANEGNAMIVDFGSNSTDVILSRDGVPIFTQTIGTGSDALTKAIASDYGIAENQAEEYKKAYGILFDQGEGKIAKSIEPIMQIIVGEMKRILTYLQQRLTSSQSTSMYILGEGANLPGLPQYLGQQLSLEVILVDPATKLSVSREAKDKLEQLNASGFSVAIGLGLKEY